MLGSVLSGRQPGLRAGVCGPSISVSDQPSRPKSFVRRGPRCRADADLRAPGAW